MGTKNCASKLFGLIKEKNNRKPQFSSHLFVKCCAQYQKIRRAYIRAIFVFAIDFLTTERHFCISNSILASLRLY